MEPNLANYWWFEHLLSLPAAEDEVVHHYADLFEDLIDGNMPAPVSARLMLRHVRKHASGKWDFGELLSTLGTVRQLLSRQGEFREGTAALIPPDELLLQVLVVAVIQVYVDDWQQGQLHAAPDVHKQAEELLHNTSLAEPYQARDDLQRMLTKLQQLFERSPTAERRKKLAMEFPTAATAQALLVEYANEAWNALGPSTLQVHQQEVMAGTRTDPMALYLQNNLPESLQGQQQPAEVGSQEEQQHTADGAAAAAATAATPGDQMMVDAAAAAEELVIPSSTAEKVPAGGAIRSPSSHIPSIPSPKTDVEEPAAAPASNSKRTRASRRAEVAAAVKKPLDLAPSKAAARTQPAPTAPTTRQAAKAAAGVKGSKRAAAAAAPKPEKQKKRAKAAATAAAAAGDGGAESDSVVAVEGSSSDDGWDSDAHRRRGKDDAPQSSPPQRGKVAPRRKVAAAADSDVEAVQQDEDGEATDLLDSDVKAAGTRSAAAYLDSDEEGGVVGKKQRKRQLCGGVSGKPGKVVLWDSEETPACAQDQKRRNRVEAGKEGATMVAAAAARKRMEAAAAAGKGEGEGEGQQQAAAAAHGEDREEFEFRAGSASDQDDDRHRHRQQQQQVEQQEATSEDEAAAATGVREGSKRKQPSGQALGFFSADAHPAGRTAASGGGGGGAAAAAGSQPAPHAKRKKYSRWLKAEEDLLVDLVMQHGQGCWAYIKELGGSGFNDRSGVDLKDKWRNIMKTKGYYL